MKNKPIKINISSTFMIKNKCKYCASGPKELFFIREQKLFDDTQSLKKWFDFLKKYLKVIDTFYMQDDPIYFKDLHHFTFSPYFNSYNPRIDKNITCPDGVTDILVCKCGKTGWKFSQQNLKSKKDIEMRKGKYCYPMKFNI